MTRFVGYIVVVAAAVMALGCGSGTNEPASAPPPTGVAVTPSAGIKGQRNFTILMSMNHGDDATLTAVCVATVSGPPHPKIKRKQHIKWNIEDDSSDPCPGLREDWVMLDFEKTIWADERDMGKEPPLMYGRFDMLRPKSGGEDILAQVYHDTSTVEMTMPTVPNGRYKYQVFYGDPSNPALVLPASPDPDFDIEGNCGSSCGP